MTRKIIWAITSLILFSSTNIRAQSTGTVNGEWISRLNELDQEAISELSKLKPHAKELAEAIRQDGIWNKFYAKHSDGKVDKTTLSQAMSAKDFSISVADKYPAMEYLRMFNHSVGPTVPEIQNAIASAMKTVGDSARKCFPNGSSFNSTSRACNKQLAGCSNTDMIPWGAKSGIMYIPVLDQNLDSQNRIFDEFKDVWASTAAPSENKNTMTLFERDFVFCKLASLVGQDFEPKVAIPPNPSPEWAQRIPITFNFNDPDFHTYTKKYCVDGKPSATILAKLANLVTLYPAGGGLKSLQNDVDSNLKSCNTVIGIECSACSLVKDKMILTYATQGCKNRDVTREDVSKDLEEWRKLPNMTEADILNHSTLLDTIDLCQAAFDAGYGWDYKQPSLGDECKQQKKKFQTPTDEPIPTTGSTSRAIESKIDGDFNGWEGETLVKLTNGQIWKQTQYHYEYHYAYMPTVLVYNSGGGYKMKVEGTEQAVGVERLK
jgi:hypothetical protein